MLDADFFEPERLRAFVAVAETGSFSRAAERLRLAQPTISIQVRRLEESIGHPLLDRRMPLAVLTKDGEAMLGYAREVLAVMNRARRQFEQPPLEGSVRLGVVEDFYFTALPEFLGDLLRRHAKFELVVRMGNAAELYNQLRTNALDVVLAKRFLGSTEGEFVCRQKMVWIGEPGLLEAQDAAVPLALTPPGTVTRELVLRALREAGRRWSIRFEAPNVMGLHAAVLAGVGVTVCGVGVIPADLTRLPDAAGLPPLPDVEFALGLNPQSDDKVVTAFSHVVRRLAPLIFSRLEEDQSHASR